MNILMIGNGFDLEHGLPTKYTDFLKFINDFNHAYFSSSNETAIRKFETAYFFSFCNNHLMTKDCINALHKFINNNLWIDYFIKVHDEHLLHKENWIDFESEISSIVQTMEHLIKYYENYRLAGAEDPVLYNFYIDTLTKFIDKESLEMDTINSNIKRMIFDLNRLICALEIYIGYYISYIKIQYYNPDILYNSFDKVISFNYSDTYSRLYAVDYADTDYHFVHGCSRFELSLIMSCMQCADAAPDLLESYMSRNNMVLGIDEYLSDDRKDKDVDFLPFKKYYQRIYKNTTSQYKNWLKEIDTNPESNKQNTLHIFGHSLDVTDGDILRDFMNHNGIKTIIYYKTQQQLGQQITNLVKVLGSNAVIEKVYGDSSITFKHQSESNPIDYNVFEIYIDITHLKQIHKASKESVNKLLSKINTNIEQENLHYFYSQDMVITLFDILQKNGLGAKYFEKLLGIAYKLDESFFFDYQKWSYQHYNYSYKCDAYTTHFIDCINQHNSNIITKPRKYYTDLILDHFCHQQLDRTNYLKLVNNILDVLSEASYDDSLWHYLVQISCGASAKIARETIQELINDTDNDYDLIQYNHLLQLMDEYEYANNGT